MICQTFRIDLRAVLLYQGNAFTKFVVWDKPQALYIKTAMTSEQMSLLQYDTSKETDGSLISN